MTSRKWLTLEWVNDNLDSDSLKELYLAYAVKGLFEFTPVAILCLPGAFLLAFAVPDAQEAIPRIPGSFAAAWILLTIYGSNKAWCFTTNSDAK